MNMRPTKDFNEKLSADQKQSLDWTRSIAVRANAGSGKTTVLVQRIVQILHNHRDLTLDNIVAITFTRKAGAQLKEKLYKALTDCINPKAEAEENKFWQDRLEELPRCPIGTIDSICQRLLKDGIEAGLVTDLDPAFGILDGIDQSELLDQAIRRTEIELKDEKAPAHEAWARWLTTQGRRELSKSLRNLLGSFVLPRAFDTALKAYRQAGFNRTCGSLCLKALVQLSSHHDLVKREIRDAVAELQGLSAKERGYKAVAKVNDSLQALMNDSTGVSISFLDAMRDALLKNDGEPRKDKLYDDKEEPKSPTLHRLTHEWQSLLKGMKFSDPGKDGLDLAEQLIQIYAVAHRYFHDLCREENRFDYQYLAQRTVELLEDRPSANHLTKEYRYILVDEFQDTNEQQWRVVAGLAGINPGQPVTSDKLMIVGDPQQSIYRFRAADPTVFERIIELIREGNKQAGRTNLPTAYDQTVSNARSTDDQRSGLMRLKKNYRSHTPLPIRIIDKLSLHAFAQVDYQESQGLEAGPPQHNEPGEVVYIYPRKAETDVGDSGDEETLTAEAPQSNEEPPAVEKLDTNQLVLVANELCAIFARHQNAADAKRRITWKNMAILLRSRRTHLINLEKVLRDAKIPYQLVGGLGFWQRQEVRDLVCLANCLANGADELAFFAVLRGPLCGLVDSELLFLSMLGGRKLLGGLQRFALIQEADCHWSAFKLDETVIAALRTACGKIADERKQLMQRVAERLGYDGTWRQRVDRMPHCDLLRMALDESGAWGVYTIDDDKEGERRLANIQLFFDEVRLLETGRGASLADTARRLKTLVDESTNDEQAELTPENNDAVQVMTVHAAKGLEFAVVAVIGLERQFRADSKSVMLLDRFQHFRKEERDSDLAKSLHGLPVISFRDPEMPLTKVRPLLHQALGKIERERTIEEEARIFHVAITRAERVLILAGAGPKGTTWPRNNSWQKWVHDALGFDADIKDGDFPVDSSSARIVRDSPDGIVQAKEAQRPDPKFALDAIRESPRRRMIAATKLDDMLKTHRENPDKWMIRYQHRVQPHAGTVPEQLIDGKKSKADKNVGKHVGTLVHRALEMGGALPKNAKERLALLLAHAAALVNVRGSDPDEPGSADPDGEFALPAAIANAAEVILKHVLPNNPFKGLLEAEGESEVDFALPVGDWIITGRFDRLILANDGSWEIVDWKTDDMAAEKIVEKYREQMKLYALALYESLPEKPAGIVVHLAMTDSRESKRLAFSSNELAELRRELEQSLPAI